MFQLDNMYPLYTKQEQCSLLERKYRLFGWARWWGKSYWLRSEVVTQALGETPVRWLVLRRTFPEVYENTVIPLLEELPREIYDYNQQKQTITFINWSTIKFSYCRNYKDVLRYQWVEFDFIAIEELTHWEFKEWRTLMWSLRTTKDVRPNFFATTNPWWIWHKWVKRLFIDKDYLPGEYAEEYWFVQSFVYENPILMERDPDYVRNLESLPEIQRKAFLEWDWDVFEGQYFDEWRKELHTCRPYIPQWRKIIAMDYWYSAPSAVYWLNKSTTWKITCYRELYVNKHTYKQLAIKIKALTWHYEQIECQVVDPAVLNKKNDATWTSFLDEARSILDWKIRWANNERINWWNKVRQALQAYTDPNSWNKTAILEVCDNCFNLIKTLPELIYDETNVEDLNTHWEDHAADALRYWLMYIWVDKLNFDLISNINQSLVKDQQQKNDLFRKKRVDRIENNDILNEKF